MSLTEYSQDCPAMRPREDTSQSVSVSVNVMSRQEDIRRSVTTRRNGMIGILQ